MVRFTFLLSLSTLHLIACAQEDALKKPLGGEPGLSRTSKPGVSRHDLTSNIFNKRCTGTCTECFGSGYTLCPDSSYYCYLPGDSLYGLDSCTSDGSSYTSTAAAPTYTSAAPTYTSATPASTATGSAGSSDFCSGRGATCVTCFGAGYLSCGDGVSCYNPNDPNYDTCPDGSSPSGGSGSSSTCADQYGSGSVPCGTDSCYNPDEGDVCCADGYHCENGNTCSSTVGKCCAPDSTASGCSGSGTGGLTTSSYTYSYSSYSYPSYSYSSYSYSSYSYSSYSYATSTEDGSTFATSSADSSSSTGTAQFAASGASGDFARFKVAGMVFSLFGMIMLLL